MYKLICLILVCLTSYSLAAEPDTTRKTFLLSGGIGGGVGQYTISAYNYGDAPFSYESGFQPAGFAASTKVRVGAVVGVARRNAVYILSHQDMYNIEEELISTILTGVGYTHYFRSQPGSIYAEFGAGFGLLDQSSETAGAGLGATIALGYEVSKHIQVGLYATSITIVDKQAGNGYYLETRTGFNNKGLMIEAKL